MPDERFAMLPYFPYSPVYVTFDSGDGDALRMAVVDKGPAGGKTVLVLHGVVAATPRA